MSVTPVVSEPLILRPSIPNISNDRAPASNSSRLTRAHEYSTFSAMTDQDNKPAELGPIARELMKLADELRALAETPLFAPEDIANDDRPAPKRCVIS